MPTSSATIITDGYNAREKAAAEADLSTLGTIPRAQLNADDKISYDVFKYQTEIGLRAFEPKLLEATIVRPIDHFSGFQVFVPDLSSGSGAAPFKTVKDYDDNLKRLAEYVVYTDRAIGRMQQGLAAGVTNPRLVMVNVVGQLDALLPPKVEDSVFYKPVTMFPATFSAADKARLTAALHRLHPRPAQPGAGAAARLHPRRLCAEGADDGRASARCPAARRCTATSSRRRRRRR